MRKVYLFCCLLLPAMAWAGPIPEPVVAMGVEVQPGNISCTGMHDGTFQLTLISNGGFVIYEWESLFSDTLGGIGSLTGSSPSDFLDSLPPGDYLFKVMNLNGNDTTFAASIIEPPPLGGAVNVLSNYSGYDVACVDGPGNGKVRAEVSGGIHEYSFLWSTGATGPVVVNLPPGQHSVQIRDANGCPLDLIFTLNAPPPLSAEVSAKREACLEQHTGQVNVVSAGGGVGPYTMTLEGNTVTGYTASWDSLSPGWYTVETQDQNGCTLLQEVEVEQGPEFEFSAGADADVFSGDTLELTLNSDRLLSSIEWSPKIGVWQDTASEKATFFPILSTEYTVRVRDENGCLSIDSIQIQVHKNRNVYFPNVFAPESNVPENQFFSAYADTGVRVVQSLRIYDRSGRLWFDGRNMPVNAAASGWHGETSDEKAESGVYFWQATVLFTDERVETYQGDVTLIR